MHAPYMYVTAPCSVLSVARQRDGTIQNAAVIKRETRRLGRIYRRHQSPEARSAWKNQFVLQRRTFQRKFSEFG